MQIYCRGNYHWYLKQQWIAPGLRCLVFDAETVGRLFMVQCSAGKCLPDESNDVRALSSLRIVDVAWDICSSGTEDGSVAVVDGATILLTPLAINNVPPPMSMYKYQLPSPCRHSFFWPSARDGWGLACLCDDSTVRLVFADSRGSPTGHIDIDVPTILSSLSNSGDARLFTLRGIAASEVSTDSAGEEGRLIAVVLYGSRETEGLVLEALADGELGSGEGGQPDEILTLTVRALDGAILSVQHSSDIHFIEDGRSQRTSSTDMSQSAGCARVGRIGLWPEDPSSLAVSLISGDDCFEVYRMKSACSLGDSSFTKGSVLRSFRGLPVHSLDRSQSQAAPTSTPPEPCVQVAVIPGEPSSDATSEPSSDATSYIDSSHTGDLVIGLTNRGKLYCGEILLVAGVSSFALNYPLQVLLYISTGTKPLLHFCSFAALR